MSGFSPPGDCPTCGAYVEAGAASCEECGSCSQTGWSDESLYDGLDLPGYDEPVGEGKSKGVVQSIWVILLLAALVFVFVLR